MIHSLKVNDVLGYSSIHTDKIFQYQIKTICYMEDGRIWVDFFPLDETYREIIKNYPIDLPLVFPWSMVSSQPIEEYI